MKSTVRVRKGPKGTSVRATGKAAQNLFDAMTRGAHQPLKPDKGQKNGSCNRRACQEPPAVYFNSATLAYYCERCARELNEAALRFDGVEELCKLDEEV